MSEITRDQKIKVIAINASLYIDRNLPKLTDEQLIKVATYISDLIGGKKMTVLDGVKDHNSNLESYVGTYEGKSYTQKSRLINN